MAEATRDVVYGIIPWKGDFPEPPPRAVVERKPTPMQEEMAKVEADETMHGKVVILAHYGKGATASATKVQLVQKYGNTAKCKGWVFKIRQVDQTDGSQRHAVMAKYDPSEVMSGAYDSYVAEKAAKAAARAAAKK